MAKTPALTIPSSKAVFALVAGATDSAMKDAGAKPAKLYNVPVGKIEPLPGFNVRVDSPDYLEHQKMLEGSIEANGYDQTKPLAGFVHKGDDGAIIYVTDGYTRLGAVKALNDKEGFAGIATLPVLVRTDAPSIDDLNVALHTNNTGRPLTPFELGVVAKRLLKTDGATNEGVAKRLSISARYLNDILTLVNSPKTVWGAVVNGQVSATQAIKELRKAGPDKQKAVDAISAMVDKATASGKAKATAKDSGPKMKTVKHTVSVAEGTDMKEIVKAVAAKVREVVKADGEGDAKTAATDGTVTILIQVPADEQPEVAPEVKRRQNASKGGAAKSLKQKAGEAAKEATAEAKALTEKAKKPSTKKAKPAAEPTPEPEPAADDLGIEGAVAASDEGQDDEAAIMPPAVTSEGGTADVEI